MNCIEVTTLIHQWEEGEPVSRAGLETALHHLSGCPSCRDKYRFLVPLLKKDSGRGPGLLPEVSLPSGLVDATMERIEGKPRIAGRPAWYFAAAAAVALVIGTVLFTHLHARRSTTVVVRFELSAPRAQSVALVGDFVDWQPDRLMLRDPDDDGIWEIRVRLKRGASYTYNFIIDDQVWITDPKSLIRVKDGFGGESSVVSL